MFCPKCGNKLVDGSAFCDVCGFKITKASHSHQFDQNNRQPSPQELNSSNNYVDYSSDNQNKNNSSEQSNTKGKKSLTFNIIVVVLTVSVLITVGTITFIKSARKSHIREAESKAKCVYFAIENELRWGNAFSEDWSNGVVMKLSDLKDSDKAVDKAIYDSITENYETEDGYVYYEIDKGYISEGWTRDYSRKGLLLAQWAESDDELCIVGQYSESGTSYKEDHIIGESF